MLPPFIHNYLLTTVTGTPDVLDGLLKPIPSDDARWDFRPDPERFTLREVIAHLADWNDVFLERMTRICDEQNPELPDRDEGQIAIDNDYTHSDPQANLTRFREGRERMVTYLQSREPEQWERVGRYKVTSPRIGRPVTLEEWMTQVAGHDGYHTQQVAQWLAASA